MPVDGHFHGGIDAHGDVVGAIGIDHPHMLAREGPGRAMQELVQGAHRLLAQVEAQIFHTYISSGAGSNTLACLTSGRWASERNSLAMAT